MEPITPDAIRALRDRLGLTQAGLAERLGCSAQAVSFWERGTRRPTGLYAREVRRLTEEAAAGSSEPAAAGSSEPAAEPDAAPR